MSVDDIRAQIQACDDAIAAKVEEKVVLYLRLAEHPDIIEQQLTIWSIPERVTQEHRIERLAIWHDPSVAQESVGAGTTLTELEEWSFQLKIDGTAYDFCASRWTGQSWDCFGFEQVFDDDGECSSDDDNNNNTTSMTYDELWEKVLRGNARNENPVAASIVTLGFRNILQGEEIINKI